MSRRRHNLRLHRHIYEIRNMLCLSTTTTVCEYLFNDQQDGESGGGFHVKVGWEVFVITPVSTCSMINKMERVGGFRVKVGGFRNHTYTTLPF